MKKKRRSTLMIAQSEEQGSRKRGGVGRRSRTPLLTAMPEGPQELQVVESAKAQASQPPDGFLLALSLGLVAALAWAYWPTLAALMAVWIREPDYTHGWLVIPFALFLLWDRRATMPPRRSGLHVGGLALLAGVVALRIFSRWAYFDFVDGWTLPLSVMGLAWAIAGRNWLVWALPGLLFLFFMIPLPFRIENELSRPLQWIATNLSTATLQVLGQPAIPEGTTILLGEQELEVERACSGLRIFMGVIAIAYVYSVLVKRAWWEKAMLMLAAIPIALAANAFRIVVTGLSYQWISSEAGQRFSHDFAGFVMIGVAALLFYLVLHYQRWIVQEVVESQGDALTIR